MQSQSLDDELIYPGTQGRRIQRQSQITVRVPQQVVDDLDAPLVLTVDGDPKRGEFRPRHVNLQVGHLGATTTEHWPDELRVPCGWVSGARCGCWWPARAVALRPGDEARQSPNRARKSCSRKPGRQSLRQEPARPPRSEPAVLPTRPAAWLPGQSDAARFEQPQGRVDSLGHPQLLHELRMLAAITLEIMRPPERKAPGDVAFGNLVRSRRSPFPRRPVSWNTLCGAHGGCGDVGGRLVLVGGGMMSGAVRILGSVCHKLSLESIVPRARADTWALDHSSGQHSMRCELGRTFASTRVTLF